MQVDPSKLYLVKLSSVKECFRKNYNRMGIVFIVEVPDLLLKTTLTLNIPRTLNAEKKMRCKFRDVVGPVLQNQYSDSLLSNPRELALILHKDLSSKTFKAYLKLNQKGIVDVEAFRPCLGKVAS